MRGVGSRFWEFYLVRYLAGTIFGVLMLYYLSINYSTEIVQSFFSAKAPDVVKEYFYGLFYHTDYDLKFSNNNLNQVISEYIRSDDSISVQKDSLSVLTAIILAVLGFLYMYISSMFVLVMHTLRIFLYRWLADGSKQHGIYSFYLRLSEKRMSYGETSKKYSNKVQSGKSYNINESETREIKDKHVKDYVESYRHLREHGNAFAIIFSEILFGSWLIVTSFHIGAIALWIGLGTIAWFAGSYLEFKFVYTEEL